MMKNKSVMNFAFQNVPAVHAPRSVFNRNCGYKSSLDTDYLYPVFCDEVLPGDTMNLKASLLFRLNSQALKPFMDNLYISTFYFFVPNRLS